MSTEAPPAPVVAPVIPDDGTKPPPPVVPDQIKDRTRKLLEDCVGGREWQDDVEQFKADLKALFPGGGRNKAIRKRLAGGRLTREESRSRNRVVTIPHVFRYAQQTFALVAGQEYKAQFKPKPQVAPPGGDFKKLPGDPQAVQFAKTIELEMADAEDVSALRGTSREFIQHGIWFRRGVVKSWWHQDWRFDPFGSEPDQEVEQMAARLQHLQELVSWGEILTGDAEMEEIEQLREALSRWGDITAEGRIEAEVVPPNRFKCDPRITSWRKINRGRYQVYDYLCTVADIRERFPYEPQEDGSWKGVHPDDLARAARVNENGDLMNQERIDRMREAQKLGKMRADDEYVMLHEQWRLDCRSVFWLLDGVEYPLDEWRPEKPTRQWYPTTVMVLNERPESASGMSDTEILGPVQDRMNSKDTDCEESREVAAGVQGLYHAGLLDPDTAGKIIEFINAGKRGLHPISGPASQKLQELVQFLEHKHDPAWFDKADDERMARFLARIPEQQMGITDNKTTATAILTANQGAAVATNDKQAIARSSLAALHRLWAELLILNQDPVEVRKRRGPHSFWPRFLDQAERKRYQAEVDRRVNEAITQEMMAERTQAMMAGQPEPQPDLMAIDQAVAQKTQQAWLELVGDDEPFDRYELFNHLDVAIDVSMAGGDLLNRAQVVANLGSLFMGLGLKVTNADPFGRLLCKIAGPDSELEDAFTADPAELVRRLAEVAAKDPSAIPPEAQAILAQLGQAAMAQMVQAQAAGGGGAPGGKPTGGVPVPSGQPGQPPAANPVRAPGTPAGMPGAG